jgi:peroxiredoxin
MLRAVLACVLLTVSAPIIAANKTAIGVGDAAPTQVLPGIGETTINLATFKGEVVLLNFWASWCQPCIQEMPVLQDLHTQSEKGLSVLAVNLDRNRRLAQGVIDHLALSLNMAFDANGTFVKLYNPNSLPASFLIGPDGAIHTVYERAISTEDIQTIKEVARRLLKGEE